MPRKAAFRGLRGAHLRTPLGVAWRAAGRRREFENGRFGEILTAAGFDFGGVTDIRYHIAPMLRRMAIICWVPYRIAKLISKESRYVNARAAVEYYRLRELMHYNIVVGFRS